MAGALAYSLLSFLCVAEHVVEKQPITEALGGRPSASGEKPHAGGEGSSSGRARSARYQQYGKIRRFVVQLVHELIDDSITDIGAMMAYYAILALFPMMVFVVTLALLVLPDNVVMQGLAMATEAMPPASREVLTTQVVALM